MTIVTLWDLSEPVPSSYLANKVARPKVTNGPPEFKGAAAIVFLLDAEEDSTHGKMRDNATRAKLPELLRTTRPPGRREQDFELVTLDDSPCQGQMHIACWTIEPPPPPQSPLSINRSSEVRRFCCLDDSGVTKFISKVRKSWEMRPPTAFNQLLYLALKEMSRRFSCGCLPSHISAMGSEPRHSNVKATWQHDKTETHGDCLIGG